MKRLSLIVATLVALCSTASAVVTQRILLKDGSVLNGFIQMQDGNGNMTISTDSAVICVSRDVFNISETMTSVTISGFAGNAEHKSKFWNCLKDKSFNNVRLIEKGATVRFVETSPNTYEIDWQDVVSIRADQRESNNLSGINRHYTLNNNREVEGEYAGETESTISLFQESGIIETIKFADVMRYTLSAINPGQEIFEQSPLLDVVTTKDGRKFRGVIIEQNYSSNKDSDNYLSIWEKEKSPQMVRISEIASISKENNADYAPKFDIILKEGEVLVNRMQVEVVKTVEADDVLLLDVFTTEPDTLFRQVVVDRDPSGRTMLTVEYNDPNASNIEVYHLVKLTAQKQKKGQWAYGFTYKDLANAIRPAGNIETSVNKTAKAQYAVLAPGRYALYDSKSKVAIPVVIR